MLLVVNVSNANIYRTGCFWKRREIYDETLFWLYAMLKFYDRVIFVQKITCACVSLVLRMIMVNYVSFPWQFLRFYAHLDINLQESKSPSSSSKNLIYLATNKFDIVNKFSNIGSSSTQLYRATTILIIILDSFPQKYQRCSIIHLPIIIILKRWVLYDPVIDIRKLGSSFSICFWKSWRISDGYLENPHCLASAARKRQSSSPSEGGVASTVSILLSICGNANGQKKATVLADS